MADIIRGLPACPYGKSQAAVMETSQSIVAIAELAGYKNCIQFFSCLQAYFGHTPGWFRKIV